MSYGFIGMVVFDEIILYSIVVISNHPIGQVVEDASNFTR